MREQKISIIVPIYNVEKYLQKCLHSLQTQTYRNLEIICVDDGSEDNSLAIAKGFAENDSRFYVISQENRGRSEARNKGMKHASGEYLMFVDSDDWIEPCTCELAVRKMDEENADLVMWTYLREYENVSKKKIIFESDCCFDEEQIKGLRRRIIGLYNDELNHPENADALSPACTKLWKTSIVMDNHLVFENTDIIGPWEDGLFTLYYLTYAKKAVYLACALYHYRKECGVTSPAKFKPDLQKQWRYRQKLLENYIEEHELDASCWQCLKNRNAWNLVSLGLNAMSLSFPKNYFQIRKILRDDEIHRDIKAFQMQYLPIHWKVLFFCAEMKMTPAVFFIFFYMKNHMSR